VAEPASQPQQPTEPWYVKVIMRLVLCLALACVSLRPADAQLRHAASATGSELGSAPACFRWQVSPSVRRCGMAAVCHRGSWDVRDRLLAWHPYIYVIRILGPKDRQR